MNRLSKRFWTIVFAVYIVICLIVDFYPTYGPPHFRYTGSDPSIEVWNLGWPIATMIYDPVSGIHIDPFAYVYFPLELGILAVLCTTVLLLRKLRS